MTDTNERLCETCGHPLRRDAEGRFVLHIALECIEALRADVAEHKRHELMWRDRTREAHAEIDRLKALVVDERVKHEDQIAALRAQLAAAQEDADRLIWVFIDTGIDQIGDVDIHSRACEINGSEDEMQDSSYLQAIREAIDAARKEVDGG